MDEQRLHHSLVRSAIENLLESEKIRTTEQFVNNFLSVLSRFCNYEEEGHKIKPRIILSQNINEATKTLANVQLIPTRKGSPEGLDLDKHIKSLIPFCNNGWHVFIDIGETDIQYGIVRSFAGPIGLPITENLFAVEDLDIVNYSMLEIKVLSKFELNICGLHKSNLVIDSRYHAIVDGNTLFPEMIDDIIGNIPYPEHRDHLQKAFSNLFGMIPYKVHGTICLVVEENYEHTEFLKDGVWLDEPIDLGEKIIDVISNNKDIISAEAYYGLSGLFLEMLNVDGITIIDTSARIRGYNVFVRSVPEGVEVPNEGGARKRAAYTVLLSGEPNIVGVYFLSQDGNSFYKRVGA